MSLFRCVHNSINRFIDPFCPGYCAFGQRLSLINIRLREPPPQRFAPVDRALYVQSPSQITRPKKGPPRLLLMHRSARLAFRSEVSPVRVGRSASGSGKEHLYLKLRANFRAAERYIDAIIIIMPAHNWSLPGGRQNRLWFAHHRDLRDLSYIRSPGL